MALFTSLETVGQFAYLVLRCLMELPAAIIRPRNVLIQLHSILVGALPLGAVAGIALGVVIWLHSHRLLARFDAADYLPEGLALAVVLELAPTGAGLVIAGRSGASLAAELGSMRLTEQIDALEVLGISPLRQLVAPRVLACVLALPLLTVLMIYLELLGSFAAEAAGGTMTWMQYQNACLRSVRLAEAIPALLKTLVFGYLIGVAGCYCGLTAHGGTEGVGRAATRGVVTSILLVLASNVLLVALIQLIV
jgi:phospholipid/cholesterol/gamma-HCH transport system permease protein